MGAVSKPANPQKLDFTYLMPSLVYKPHVSITHPPAHQAEMNSLRILFAVNATWDQTANMRDADYKDWHFTRELETAPLQHSSSLSCLLTGKTSSVWVTETHRETDLSLLYPNPPELLFIYILNLKEKSRR